MSKSLEIDALLLSAGFGSRLRPLTDFLPKTLMPVLGRPLLEIWLQMLIGENPQNSVKVHRLVVNTHYKADLVRSFVGGSVFAPRVTLSHEEKLLGTAGSLLKNKASWSDRPILLVHADNLSIFDLSAFVDAHQARPSGCAITMMTFDTNAPSSCGIVKTDAHGVVSGFFEKAADPPGNLANAAVYLLEPSVLVWLESLKREIIDFSTEVIPAFLGKIFTFHNGTYHRDIGNVPSWLMAQFEYATIQQGLSNSDSYLELFKCQEGKLLTDLASAIESKH